jgi:hypothetical protein
MLEVEDCYRCDHGSIQYSQYQFDVKLSQAQHYVTDYGMAECVGLEMDQNISDENAERGNFAVLGVQGCIFDDGY